MRKLGMATLLPLVHFVVSIGVFGWKLFPFQEPTSGIRLWFALNGPILLLVDLSKRIATIPWLSPHIMGGVRPIYLIFFVGGFALWFFVGRALDNLFRRNSLDQKALPLSHVLVDMFLIACGVRLIFHGLENILPQYPGQQHSTLGIVNGVIVLVWAFVLLLVPSWKLLSAFRNRGADPSRSAV
jgi:hypothetical protein